MVTFVGISRILVLHIHMQQYRIDIFLLQLSQCVEVGCHLGEKSNISYITEILSTIES